MSDPQPSGDTLNAMLPSAIQLVGAVRARDPDWVASILNPLTPQQANALLIAVAAMVPDDVHTDQLLLWTHGPAVQDQVYGQTVVVELGGGKRCSRCETELPLDQFCPDPRPGNPDHRKSRCKACISEVVKERKAARDTNRSAIAASSETDSGEAVAA